MLEPLGCTSRWGGEAPPGLSRLPRRTTPLTRFFSPIAAWATRVTGALKS
jgi:hypothetical protein